MFKPFVLRKEHRDIQKKKKKEKNFSSSA